MRRQINIIFRVDASLQMGSGHVMRCLTLGQELLRAGAGVCFVCREHEGHMAEQIKQHGISVFKLPPPAQKEKSRIAGQYADWLGVDWRQDARETIASFDRKDFPWSTKDISWLVVDHYTLDSGWHNMLRPYVQQIMVIDDLANRRLDCDLLLDQTLDRTAGDYKKLVDGHCVFLTGTEFALLRPQFAVYRKMSLFRRKNGRSSGRILVSMGGMDPANLSGVALAALELLPWHKNITVDMVLGVHAPHYKEICRRSSESFLKIKVHHAVKNMAELMTRADFAIGTGGITSWERCCLGLPTLLVVEEENQRLIASRLEELGAIIAIQLSEHLQNDIAAATISLFTNPEKYIAMSNAAANVCHGTGAEIVAARMMRYV